MAEPVWIRRDVVLAIHLRQLAEHGGPPGVRDEGLLDSALARLSNLHAYSDKAADVPALAAAYAFGISSNHPFVDGNKRTAYAVCRTFLLLNGFDLTAGRAERYKIFVRLAAGELSETKLAEWLREQSVPR